MLISALSFAPLAELPLRGAEISASAPPPLNFHPGPEYGPAERKYQGIPTIERAPNGRLWAAWYAGPVQEDRYNYVVLVTSPDDGRTWSDLRLVIDPDGFGPIRASDPCLWIDPRGRLWLFWFQNPDKDANSGPRLFAITAENPSEEHPRWSTPRLLGEGIALNKPIILSNGDWLLPSAIWRRDQSCRVLASSDQGETWSLRGTAGIPRPEDRQCDEPMIVERRDGSLWMLVRTNYGIGETVSTDQGRTWAPITPTALPHTPTRFFLRRLVSGRLLLVKHGPLTGKPVGRKQLMAYLSDDDGRTWQGGINVPGYAASQGGVGQLTQAFANEWAGRGVNVDAIAPGYAATDNTQALRDNPVRSQQILSRIPAGRWATPEDFQGVAVFLASDASAYLHGGGVISLGGRCRARNVAFGYGVPLLIS